MLTKDDFRFHLYDDAKITKKMSANIDELPKNVSYRLNTTMRFRFNIQSEDDDTKATLLWPAEPYSQILVFVPYQSADLNNPQKFSGRLMSCDESCQPLNIDLKMKNIINQLEEKFPTYKGKLTQLPSILLDTAQTPNGLAGYLQDTNKYWLAFIISLIFSGIYLLLEMILSRKSKVKSH